MSSADRALPGGLDAATWFGERFHDSDDRLMPGGEAAEQAADFMELTVNHARFDGAVVTRRPGTA